MDGNGRWAKKRGLPRNAGHKKGAERVLEVTERAFRLGVKVVSIFGFSSENWSRPKAEVDKIFDYIRSFLDEKGEKLIKNRIKLIVSGDVNALPEALRESIYKRERETSAFSEPILNLVINYGSRQEILRAVNLAIKSGKGEITEDEFSSYLYTSGLPDPDLIIRTSGEERLSNFLMYQSAYSELYFTSVLWPDFGAEELDKALKEFSQRNRRFGASESKQQ